MFGFLNKSIPEWVRHYPGDPERETLLTLAKSSRGDFSKPREMNYVLLMDEDDKTKADRIVSILEKDGWNVSSGEIPGENTFFFEAQNTNYRLTAETFTHDVTYFKDLAKVQGIEYDGWFASS